MAVGQSVAEFRGSVEEVEDFGGFAFERRSDRLRIPVDESGKVRIREMAVGCTGTVRHGAWVVWDHETGRYTVAGRVTDERILAREFGVMFGDGDIDSDRAFRDFIEGAWTNGWDFVEPGAVGAMTDAPILTRGADEDENGNAVPGEGCPVYWHRAYMVESPLRSMLQRGFVYFQRES